MILSLSSSVAAATSRVSRTSGRLISLTLASALLLAAGEASNSVSSGVNPTSNDSILAPMSPADASAASAALAATLPAGVAAEAVLPAATADIAPAAAPVTAKPAQLSKLVHNVDTGDVTSDADLRCLATAVYFESRGEPLEGQLAVAQAIINRVESGRYADSICGVINQRGQFSFDRRRTPAAGADWRTAQAIARIAADDMWHEVTPRAVSFHAARLSPGWKGKVRIAQIGNHVFYR